LDKALQLSPRNAQAIALKGFVLAAQNRVALAQETFEEAIAADNALGNAWLGRGLTKIRRGQADEGRADLQVAATLEPQRALLRSYLGKAFSNARDNERADKELALARKLDPNDPTAWLYSALLAQQQNQINRGVRDLEQAQALSQNRRLFRSRMLLDQDRAVGSANLASLYRDAGMLDFSRREAARAVDADYAAIRGTSSSRRATTFSAILSKSIFARNTVVERTPARESARARGCRNAFAKHLAAGILETFQSATAWPQLQHGISQPRRMESVRFPVWHLRKHKLRHRRGVSFLPGQQIEQRQAATDAVWQVQATVHPQDSLLVQAIYYNAEAGDLAQYYDPAEASPTLRLKRSRSRISLLAGTMNGRPAAAPAAGRPFA
jgi:tetratricopeptide (TPR) repeat protein